MRKQRTKLGYNLRKWWKKCEDKVEEIRKEVHDCMKDWGETKATMKKEAEEWLEKERNKWREDARVQIEGFKENGGRCYKWFKIRRRR